METLWKSTRSRRIVHICCEVKIALGFASKMGNTHNFSAMFKPWISRLPSFERTPRYPDKLLGNMGNGASSIDEMFTSWVMGSG
jgi:hypothetical protein